MSKERLYIKIVIPNQGKERKKQGGGGKCVPFQKVTPQMRTNLTLSLDTAEKLLDGDRLSGAVVPLKVKVRPEAIAKSHWRGGLFNEGTCPVVGAGKPGEFYLRGTKKGINHLRNLIGSNNSDQVLKEISAIKELSPFNAEDRLGGADPNAIYDKAPGVGERRAVKVKLFSPGAENYRKEEILAFERQLQSNSISFVRQAQFEKQDIYVAICRSREDMSFLANILSIRSISNIPQFKTLRSTRFNPRPAPADLFDSEDTPGGSPIVGVVDSGVSTRISELQNWMYGKERHVAEAEENTYHGTFVAGLIVWGHVLNSEHPEIGRHPCRILDIHVLPNSDPTVGEVGSITESELLQDLEQALIKHSNEVKVWNLSLGSDEVCSLDQFSDFAVQLDNLQEKFGITFVIAAGNYAAPSLLNYPRNDADQALGRITSPADSVLGITVGSISHLNHPSTGTLRGEPSPFSRGGPGPNHIIKPDLVHFGGNIGRDFKHALGVVSLDDGPSIAEDIGTSFAAPLVARQLAWIHHGLTPTPSAMMARAILTHNALDVRSGGRVQDQDDRCLGFGMPHNIDRALECDPWKMTMVFEEVLRPGYFLEWDSFPFPESLMSNGKFKGEIWMTLAYPPARNPDFGAEYCETHVDAHFGVYVDKNGKDKFKGQVPVEHPNKGRLHEAFQVQALRKWAPVRTYHRRITNGIEGKRWRLYVELLCRHGVEEAKASNQPFALILTIADPERKAPIYDEMARILRTSFQTQNLSIRPSVRVQQNQ